MTDIDRFITTWKQSGGAELANSQSFLKELCDLLGAAHPEPTRAEEDENHYVFEKHVKLNNGDGSESDGRIDLYRKGHFILESKQGSERKAQDLEERLARPDRKRKQRTGTAVRGTQGWSNAMFKAFQQAKNYAAASPEDGWPPFLIVVDIGHCFDLYADFTGQGKAYTQFPDPQSYRIKLDDLADEEVRRRLQTIWTDPLALDPSRKTARVTRELAARLAKLAKLLEAQRDKTFGPEIVSEFLMRCLFTMFAEVLIMIGEVVTITLEVICRNARLLRIRSYGCS